MVTQLFFVRKISSRFPQMSPDLLEIYSRSPRISSRSPWISSRSSRDFFKISLKSPRNFLNISLGSPRIFSCLYKDLLSDHPLELNFERAKKSSYNFAWQCNYNEFVHFEHLRAIFWPSTEFRNLFKFSVISVLSFYSQNESIQSCIG